MTTVVVPSAGPTWGAFKTALAERGFDLRCVGCPPDMIHGERPNYDRAQYILEATTDLGEDMVVVGCSNEGLILPLIAAERKVRRLVYVEALIAQPGRVFIEFMEREEVFVPGLLEATIRSTGGITR